jgi:hypothetical protein
MCDPTKFATRYVEVFNDKLGVSAVAEQDGDVHATLDNGLRLCVVNTAPSDPEVLRIYTSFKTDLPKPALDATIATVNRNMVGAKLFAPADDFFVVTVQMVVAGRDCLPTSDHLAAVLPRAISMIISAVAEFNTELTLLGITEATENAA